MLLSNLFHKLIRCCSSFLLEAITVRTSVDQQIRDGSEVVGTGEVLRSGLSCDSAFAGVSDAS